MSSTQCAVQKLFPENNSTYINDYHFSDEWSVKLLNIWLNARKELMAGNIQPEDFKSELVDGIVREGDWYGDYLAACEQEGGDPSDTQYELYVKEYRDEAFNLIPSSLHAELCIVPGWDGVDLDDLLDELSLNFAGVHYHVDSLLPGAGLATFLKMVNLPSAELVQYAESERGATAFAESCREAGFNVVNDPAKPSLMTPAQVVEHIDNAYRASVPMFHCEINLRALFMQVDPTRDFELATKRGEVHVGFHDFLNGAGYMDTYKGSFTVQPDEKGLVASDRWGYGMEVYGLVRSFFYAVPAQEPDQAQA